MDDDEKWKINLIKDLVNSRRQASVVRNDDTNNAEMLTLEEINHAIVDVCTN